MYQIYYFAYSRFVSFTNILEIYLNSLYNRLSFSRECGNQQSTFY